MQRYVEVVLRDAVVAQRQVTFCRPLCLGGRIVGVTRTGPRATVKGPPVQRFDMATSRGSTARIAPRVRASFSCVMRSASGSSEIMGWGRSPPPDKLPSVFPLAERRTPIPAWTGLVSPVACGSAATWIAPASAALFSTDPLERSIAPSAKPGPLAAPELLSAMRDCYVDSFLHSIATMIDVPSAARVISLCEDR